MTTLPKDIVEKITNELTPQELIVFMNPESTPVNSRLTPGIKRLLNSDDFWWRKLKRDFYFIYSYMRRHNIEKNPKNAYLKIFSAISRNAEYNSINTYSSRNKYDFIYNVLFSLLERIINEEAFSQRRIKKILEETKFSKYLPEGVFLDIKFLKENISFLFYEIITEFLGIEIESEVPFTGWGF